MAVVRVSLKDMQLAADRIRFDLSIDDEFKPVADIAYFGFFGSMAKSEYSNGVLLTADGEIDMGGGYESSGRFHRTNLLSKTIRLGEYATIWWKWGADAEETTYAIEAVTLMSAVTNLVKVPEATQFHVESVASLPRFRARVIKSFDIHGYDNVVYRPPVGVEGDVAYFQDQCIFCPDDAISKSGMLISECVTFDDIELISFIDEVLKID